MALFSISQERIDLTKAKFAYVKAFRRESFWGFSRTLGISKLKRFAFNEDRYIESHPDSALAKSRAALESAALRYAEFRAGIKRFVPDALRKSVDLRAKLEVATAIRLSAMSYYERSLGASLRFLFKSKVRAGATAVALAGLLFLTPVGKGVAVKVGSLHTKDAIAGLLYGGARAAGAYSPYANERMKDLLGTEREETIWEGARRYAKRRTFASDASAILGLGGGFALREYFADAVANWFHLSSPDEVVRQTIPHARDGMLDLIAERQGMPTYLPISGSESADLASIANEGQALALVRAHSPELDGLYNRLVAITPEKHAFLNSPENAQLLDVSIASFKRLAILESARERAEQIAAQAAAYGMTDAQQNALNLLSDSTAQLSKERAYADVLSRVIDDQTGRAWERFTDDHQKSIVELAAEYATAHPQGADTWLPMGLEAGPHTLPLSEGAMTPENLYASLNAVSLRLREVDAVISGYGKVISTNDETYQKLLTARASYTRLSGELQHISPSVEHLPDIRDAIGGDPTASGGVPLADALLREQIQRIPFADYDSHWSVVVDAAKRVSTVSPGMAYVDGDLVPLKEVVSFKDGVYPFLPPELGHFVYGLNEELEKLGVNFSVTEGFKPTTHVHHSICHYNGTCIDMNLTDHAYTPERIYDVFLATDKLGSHNAVTFETPSGSEHAVAADELRMFLERKGVDAATTERFVSQVKHIPWGTAPHFHVECKDCVPSGGHIVPQELTSPDA